MSSAASASNIDGHSSVMKVTHKRTMVENRTVQGSCYLVKMGKILNDYTNVRIGWKVDQWLSIDE